MAYYPGKGTVLMISTANSSTALGACTQVVSISPPQISHPSVDVTHLGSSEREFVGSIADYGTFGASIEYDPNDATHARLLALARGTTGEEYRIVFPTTINAIKFKALLNNLNLQDAVVDDVWRASLDWKITGPVTVTTA
jgi:hypothetical protein